MGFGDQRRQAERQQNVEKASSSSSVSSDENEKTLVPPSPAGPGHFSGNATPNYLHSGHSTPRLGSRRNSFGSIHSQASFMDDIKHEVMVNYLFQQQCSALWVGDGSGQVEGVLLRKAKGFYMSCPPQLVESPFGQACATLNVQVSRRETPSPCAQD